MNAPGVLGLGSWSPTVFHKVQVIAISGDGSFTRPNDPAAKKAVENPDHPVRAKIARINQIISKFDDGMMVRFVDINHHFLETDGRLSKKIMANFLHPTIRGYEIWSGLVAPRIREMLETPAKSVGK